MRMLVSARLFAVTVVFLMCAHTSRAQLGQIARPSLGQLGSLRVQNSEAHTGDGFRYDQFSSGDLVVKQFVNPATNIVFGMTWKGKRMPSLLPLLGFDPYKITGPGVSRSLHATHIRTDMLAIDITSIMGHFEGRAVRIDLLPGSVSMSVVTP